MSGFSTITATDLLAWRKAKERDTWHQVVSTATLCYGVEFATKKKKQTSWRLMRSSIIKRTSIRLNNNERNIQTLAEAAAPALTQCSSVDSFMLIECIH